MDNQRKDDRNETTVTSVTPQDQTTVLFGLEELIKNIIASMDTIKGELKKQREMFSDTFINDPVYKEKEEIAKKAVNEKSALKKNLLAQPQLKQIAQKIRDMNTEIKEKSAALSDYLLEYQRLYGVNEIEGHDGEVREIVHQAKVIKKSTR